MDIAAQGSELVWRASELDTGTQCMRKLGYARLGVVSSETGEAIPVRNTYSWDLVGGLAVDDVLCCVSLAQIHDSPLTEHDWVSFFGARFDWNTTSMMKNGIIEGTEEDRRSIFSDGLAVTQLYIRDTAPILKPIAVQSVVSKTVSTSVGPVKLVGHVDLIREGKDGSKIISDWKFTKKTPGQMPARSYSRGWAYDYMAGDEHHQIELIYLRKGLKTPKVETDSHFVSAGERAQVEKQLGILAKMYQQKYFPMADPSSWACSKDWCSYWSVCRGHPVKPQPIPGESL